MSHRMLDSDEVEAIVTKAIEGVEAHILARLPGATEEEKNVAAYTVLHVLGIACMVAVEQAGSG